MQDFSEVDYEQTAASFRKNRYLPVRSILPPSLLGFAKVYYGILYANGRFFKDSQCPRSLALGGDPALDAMLEWIRPRVTSLVGFALTPTYSYTRIYAKGDELHRHVDRPSCEVSLTISINIPEGSNPSQLRLKPPNLDETTVEMLEGDGCIYAGTEVEHWRDPFTSDGYAQLFLHFISTHGKYFPRFVYDEREWLGAPKLSKHF